jgi:beta-glucosidase
MKNKTYCAFAVSLLLMVGASTAEEAGRPMFRDPSQPIEKRVQDLVRRMTLEEKATALNHKNTGIPRLGIPMWGGWNQTLHGVWSTKPTTLFPATIAMGATWDPELVHTIADAMSDEARALYNDQAEGPRGLKAGLVFRSPVINIARDPRWGRIQEIFSEDSYLTGRMAVAYVKGLQGEDVNHLKLAATLKHYVVYNVEEGRKHGNAQVDDRNLMEYYLPHWQTAIREARAQSIMSSYNRINGVPSAVNHRMLTEILRGKFGFDGFVTDDLGAVGLLTAGQPESRIRLNEIGQRFSEDPVVSTAAAIKAGNDSDDEEFQENIPTAVQRGLLTMKDVDQAVSRVMRVGFRLGVFDPSTWYDNIKMDVVRAQPHLDLARRAAEESMVLLANKLHFLPLEQGKIKSVAVIGPAGDQDYETGNYYGKVFRKVGVTQGLRQVLGQGVKVQYEQGASYHDPADADMLRRAAELARNSDVVILCLGTNLSIEAEGLDRRDLKLPGDQQRLMEAVYAANPKTVLVLQNAGALGVGWAADHLPGILEAWYPGEDGGIAIAEALFGKINPGGHLPYTMYTNLNGIPPSKEYDISKGFTYEYFKGVPLYAFGHGMSYTDFAFRHMSVSAPKASANGSVTVSFDVTNTGDREGSTVAQLYTHQRRSVTYQPISTLRNFRRVRLKPGETTHVSFELKASQLAYYHEKTASFAVEPGTFDLMVGSASDAILLYGALDVSNG